MISDVEKKKKKNSVYKIIMFKFITCNIHVDVWIMKG